LRPVSAATFRLHDLEIDASFVLGTHDPQKGPQGFGSLSAPANHLSHVFGMEMKADEHSHFVNRALGFHIVGMIYERFYDKVDKSDILVSHLRISFALLINKKPEITTLLASKELPTI
jgi:hypothetical protein